MGGSPLIIIEIVLVFGGVLLWGGWQLWTLRKENEKAARRELEEASRRASDSAGQGGSSR